MPPTRSAALDCAKCLAVSAIVLVHGNSVLPGPRSDALGTASSAALAVLFLVSGHVSGRRLLARSSGAADLAARLLPLLWLYALWQPVVLLQRSVLAMAQGHSIDPLGELARFIAAPLRPNGELWYLWALALHLVFVAATRRLPTWVVLAPTAAVFVIWNAFGDVVLGQRVWHVLGPGLQGLPQFAFFTLLGARLPSVPPARRLLTLGLLGASLTTAALLVHALGPVQWARPTGSVLGALAVLCLSGLAARRRGLGLLARVGQKSVAPYLAHMSVLTVLAVALKVLGLEAAVGAARPFVLIGATVTAVALPTVVHHVVRGTRAAFLFNAPNALQQRAHRLVPTRSP